MKNIGPLQLMPEKESKTAVETVQEILSSGKYLKTTDFKMSTFIAS